MPRLPRSLQSIAQPLASSGPRLRPHLHPSSQCSQIATFSTSCSPSARLLPRSESTAYSKRRRAFYAWLETTANKYTGLSQDGSTNYVTGSPNRPFPNNPAFLSQPVLSEEARDKIHDEVMVKHEPIKVVSARYSIDMRRVAAVVRMKEIENRWKADGKYLATPYRKAVLSMLPQTRFAEGEPEHENVNEIHVHSYTMQQLFPPAGESRQFTRADAAKAFGDHILPADVRVPVPEMIQREKDVLEGHTRKEAEKRFSDAAIESEQAYRDRLDRMKKWEDMRLTKVDTDRFELRFRDVSVNDVGRNGRSRKGVGWRYGVPFHDRKPGQVKIPTKVGW